MSGRVIMYPGPNYNSIPTAPWMVETPTGNLSIPKTNSQGLIEALAYAKINRLNMTVEAGQDSIAPQMPILCLGETVVIGPMRNGDLQFNGIHISTTIDVRGPALVIESQMITEIAFHGGEIIGYPSNGGVVQIRPTMNNVPSDPVNGVGSTVIKLPAITCGYAPVNPNVNPVCLQLTPGSGSGIAGMHLEYGELNGSGIPGARGIVVADPGAGATFSQNDIIGRIGIHECPGGNVVVGQGASGNVRMNKWRLKGVLNPNATFLATYAQQDFYDMTVEGNGSAGGVAVIEMIGGNIFDGFLKGCATGFAYPRPNSVYRTKIAA